MNRKTLSHIVLVSFGCIANTAIGADKELLDILLANGAITEAQYEQLLKKDEIEKSDVDQIVVQLDEKGFNVASADGDYAIKIGTRLHAEASTHSGDLPAGEQPRNGTEFRRARLEMKGKIADDFSWAAEIDFADNDTSIKDFWLGYTTRNGMKLTFGHQKQPSNLSLEMSSNDLPFIERPITDFLLAPLLDRAIGVRAEQSGNNWFAAAGVYGESVSPNAPSNDEGWGASARFVYAPIIESDRVLHLGVRAATRAPAQNLKTLRIRDETTHMSNLSIVNTGFITGLDRTDSTGIEAAFALGPFSIVGEYAAVGVGLDNASDLDFDGWNVYSTWSLTGESRASAYRIGSGEFKRLTPAADFSRANGTWGAWEIALRYANIDLNDGTFVGGEESVLTTGLNWYLNTNIRLMLEWSRIVDTDGSTELREAADGLDIFQFRSQYTF
jgi:phosphate-selective porin OprO/OprP